jgi:hypothetical protein
MSSLFSNPTAALLVAVTHTTVFIADLRYKDVSQSFLSNSSQPGKGGRHINT